MGTDVSEDLLQTAGDFCDDEALTNVELVIDELFDSRLPAHPWGHTLPAPVDRW